MAQIYDRPVHQLMREMVADLLVAPDSIMTRLQAIAWFAEHYPKVKPGTVAAHLMKLATNEPTRLHYNHRVGDDDLLFKVQPGRYRLFDRATDPTPITTDTSTHPKPKPPSLVADDDEEEDAPGFSQEFAYERDLRNYLSKNLTRLEPGLRLYDEEGINGIEFPVGGRYIDILAVSAKNELVVIELKVARGYDRVVGQLLRYIGWIEQNLAETSQSVRGMIVAREISDDLKLACARLNDVALFEYDLQVHVRGVSLWHRGA